MTGSVAETVACDGGAWPHASFYQDLMRCAEAGAGMPAPGLPGTIWQAIDALRAEGAAGEEIGILERMSVEIHRLRQSIGELRENADADVEARTRIAALTGQWLGVARIAGYGTA